MGDNVVALNTQASNGQLIIVLEGREYPIGLADANLTINSTEDAIMEVAKGQLVELGKNISDIDTLYKVHKAFDSGNVYIVPNSVPGV